MRVRQEEVERLSRLIVKSLVDRELISPTAPPARLEAVIVDAFLEIQEREQKLEEEAERLAVAHTRGMVGIDQGKVIDGIKQRLAKERDFPL